MLDTVNRTWNDERIRELRMLWLKGFTCDEISRKMKLSKNQIIGKVHRLKLPQRKNGSHGKLY